MAYSVNSDSGDPANEDSLYLIDLSTGYDQRRGTLATGIVNDVRRDTEGLAFDRDGTLWGVDDSSRSLFPINVNSGSINIKQEILLPAFRAGGSHDFGMTFNCNNNLYVSSVVARTLYKLDLQGNTQAIGSAGALGANISALAAYDSPTTLYGLGNGQFSNGETDSPNLYSIDVVSGVATLIGPLGENVGDYNQGGLAFDEDGVLWAITDRRIINNSIENQPSQILRIDTNTGSATVVSHTNNEVGFESLAIAPPAICNDIPPGTGTDFPIAEAEGVPALNPAGRLLAIIALLMAGMTILHRRIL